MKPPTVSPDTQCWKLEHVSEGTRPVYPVGQIESLLLTDGALVGLLVVSETGLGVGPGVGAGVDPGVGAGVEVGPEAPT